MAAQMHAVPKVVDSITLDRADWQNPALIGAMRPPKSPAQNSSPARTSPSAVPLWPPAAARRLLDEFDRLLLPVVAGHGKRPFGVGGTQAELRLAESQTFDSGSYI